MSGLWRRCLECGGRGYFPDRDPTGRDYYCGCYEAEPPDCLIPVPQGAVLIEDTEQLTDEIARIIHDEYHWQTDGIITPECVDLCEHAAGRIVAFLAAVREGET